MADVTEHHLNDDEDPGAVAATLRDALAPGSYLAIIHFWDPAEEQPEVAAKVVEAERVFNETLGTGRWRKRSEIQAYFGDFDPFGDFDLIFLPWILEIAYGARDPQSVDLKHGWTPGGDRPLARCLKEPLSAGEDLVPTATATPKATATPTPKKKKRPKPKPRRAGRRSTCGSSSSRSRRSARTGCSP